MRRRHWRESAVIDFSYHLQRCGICFRTGANDTRSHLRTGRLGSMAPAARTAGSKIREVEMVYTRKLPAPHKVPSEGPEEFRPHLASEVTLVPAQCWVAGHSRRLSVQNMGGPEGPRCGPLNLCYNMDSLSHCQREAGTAKTSSAMHSMRPSLLAGDEVTPAFREQI